MIDPVDLHDVFDRAASLPAQDRAAFLARACGDNLALRQEVERLLAADARAGTVFESRGSDSDASTPPTPSDRAGLPDGTRLGPYVVLGRAGAGGMGEVYRARDTRLDRIVAIKVLPAELVRDANARRRFEREARAAAALTHPHICTLLDIGRQGDSDYLVMECVDGETLAHRLGRAPVPLKECLRVVIEIGEALAAAHAAHIVHRDIKPGNVMLRPDGFIKVLDFGLAKLTTPIPTDGSDTTRVLSTRAGLILGTVAYMSPEQARGQDVDARTDIWSLGCVLYEMAAGRPPFAGTSTTDVLAAVLQSDPVPLPVIDPAIPAELQRIVGKTLRKDRDERYQTAQDVVVDLKTLREELPQTGSRPQSARPASVTAPGDSRRLKRLWLSAAAAAAVLVGGLVGAGLWWRAETASTGGHPTIFDEAVPLPLARITFDSGLQSDPTFSPDGRFVAYSSDKAGNFDIWVQPVAGGDAVQVTKSTAHETQPAWSPDGSSIVFRSERDGGGLYIIPALGGVERRLTTFGLHPSWTVDGKTIRFLADRPPSLYSVAPPAESPRQILPEFTASGDWRWIGFHPDGRVSFLGFHKQRGYGFFTVSTAGDIVDSRIMMNAPTELANMKHSGGQRFHWMNDGRGLIFETENNSGVQNIWKVVIDPSTLGWMAFERLTSGSGADVDAAVSSDGGRLMFSNRQMSDRLWQFRLDDRHRLVDGQPFTQDYGVIFGMDISSDGRTAAFGGARLAEDPPTVDVWIAQLSSRRDQIVAKSALAPVWSADRRWLAYIRYKSDTTDPTKIDQPAAIAVRDTAGGPEQIITPWSSESWWEPSDWIGASRAVVACHGSHVVTWPVGQPAGIASSRQLFEVPSKNGELHQARVSPNGRWLSFVLRREGTQQIGVTTVVGPPNRGWTTIPTGSEWVDQARWSPDGTTLYYLVRTARDMFNVWGLSFDPESGRTNGPPFALTQYDSPALIVRDAGLTVLEHSAFLALHSSAGNIWMLDKLNR